MSNEPQVLPEKAADQFIWAEAYRPRTVGDCILPQDLEQIFTKFVEVDDFPNLLLTGEPGTGKTTVARAVCEQLGYEYLFINGSEESGIDVLRTKIKDFASTVSLAGKTKVVILDEADFLNPNSTQPALRGFIDEFSKKCRFIFTCNYRDKIIPALHSRLTALEFTFKGKERAASAGKFFHRILHILRNEGVAFENAVVAELVKRNFPDFRHTLIELQQYAVARGEINGGILGVRGDRDLDPLIQSLKAREFKTMRQWVADNGETFSASIFRRLYEALVHRVKDDAPKLIILLNDYQYKSAFCADQELNLTACLVEIMLTCAIQ